MHQDRLIRFDGIVAEALADGKYRVRFSNGHEIVAYTDADSQSDGTTTIAGEQITVEISPHDLNSGRLIFRRESGNRAESTNT